MTCVSYTNTFQVSNRLNDEEIKYEKGGTIYVWGNSANGGATTFAGNAGQIPDLNDVVNVYACDLGYAALLKDSSVYVWGNPLVAGTEGFLTLDNLKVTGVKTIRATAQAFAAIMIDGSVIVWGVTNLGGTVFPSAASPGIYSPPTVAAGLSNITKIYSTYGAFAAVDSMGSVWTWGSSIYGAIGNGDLYNISEIYGVVDITCSQVSFAALLPDTTVYVWGYGHSGYINASQNIPGVVTGLTNVKKVYSVFAAFAALRNDGTVFIWGELDGGGSLDGATSYTNLPISNVTNIYSTSGAFCAQLDDQVYVWGNPGVGGNIIYGGGYNPIYIPNIKNVCGNSQAFAGLTADNRIYIWGDPSYGGSNVYNNASYYGIISISENITEIVGSGNSFAALNESGQVLRWGEYLPGGGGTNGNPEFVPDLNNIQKIFANNASIGTVNNTNKVTVWGKTDNGGNNSQVADLNNFGAVFSSYAGGAYAVLQLEPEPPVENFSPVLAGFIGAILGLFIFVSFYYIGRIETESYRYAAFLAVIFISVGVVILVSTLT